MATSERAVIRAITYNPSTTSRRLINTTTSSSRKTIVNSLQTTFPFPATVKNPITPITSSSGQLLPESAFVDYEEYVAYLIKNGVPPVYTGTSQNTNKGTYSPFSFKGTYSGDIVGDISGKCSGEISGTIRGINVSGTITGTATGTDRVADTEGTITGTISGTYLLGKLTLIINGISEGTLEGNVTGTIIGTGGNFNGTITTGNFTHKNY